MLKFVILVFTVACALGAAVPEGTTTLPQVDDRIVGGGFAAIRTYPWQVSVQYKGTHICGGSIYSAKVIVTAAHCMESVSASDLKVRAGSAYWKNGGTLAAVASFKTHKKFNPNTMVNDVAVIHLRTALKFGEKIKAIGLTKNMVSNGTLAVVSGWGATYSGSPSIPDQLKYVKVQIIRRLVCASSEYDYNNDIKETMICAAAPGKDACQADSGGPLVADGVLVGIVSWGYGCATARFPGVYASVFALRSWIEANARVS